MPGIVPDEGSKSARLVLIGEAPGEWEDKYRRPFVGPSGQRWESWLGRFGLARSDFYITNVWPERPHANRIETVNREQLAQAVDRLHDRLAALHDPWLIVPTGNTALRALMGRPLWGKDSPKITDWRGSILGYQDRRGRVVKVIPTLHPAYTFREPGAERACLHDWKRVARDSKFRELRLPEREHVIGPTIVDLENFVEAVLADQSRWLAFDIETSRRQGNQITCIGFSVDPGQSFVVPTTAAYWAGKAELDYVWELIARLLHGKNPKVTQNGHYDYYWLGLEHDIVPVNWKFDCLAQHHCLDATDHHALDYQASIDTRQPFWKRMTRESEQGTSVAAYGSDERTLWTYNGIDSCTELELAIKYDKRLERRGLREFYLTHYRDLQRPALDMMKQGIRVDEQARSWWHFSLQAERIEIQDRLEALAGVPLHAKKALSNVKVNKFLYGKEEGGLGLPPQRNRKAKNKDGTTANEVAIRKLTLWTFKNSSPKWERAREALGAILEERRREKLVSFLNPKSVDADGRFRATFKLTTVTGRFASAKNPMWTGGNLQNQDREIRKTFVPNNDKHIFLEADMSQVEGRIVYVRSEDPALIRLAQLHPSKFDMHTYNASIIFRKPEAQVTKGERYLAKKSVHGAQRGLGGEKLAGEILKEMEGKVIKSPAECSRYIGQYLAEHPAIEGKYFPLVRRTLLKDKKLTNVWGREWSVKYERFTDELYRKGYSWWPQSDAGDLMNQQGLKPLWRWLRKEKLDATINAQVHDSLLISCRPRDAYDIAAFLKESLEQPMDYGHTKLSVPVEFKLGRSWAGDLEFKQLPPREEFIRLAKVVRRGGQALEDLKKA